MGVVSGQIDIDSGEYPDYLVASLTGVLGMAMSPVPVLRAARRRRNVVAVATLVAASPVAALTPTPQPPDQSPSAVGPNRIQIVEVADTILSVHVSFLGYHYTGDLVSTPNAPWGIGPHFKALVGANDANNYTSFGRIYWLQPGSSLSDPVNARVSGLAIESCFCSNAGPNVSFVSNLPVLDIAVNDASNFWRIQHCRADNQFVNCPILADGASQLTPLSYETADGYVYPPDLTVSFHDARFASATPEPATWAMFVAGFAAAGIGLRRSRASLPRASR